LCHLRFILVYTPRFHKMFGHGNLVKSPGNLLVNMSMNPVANISRTKHEWNDIRFSKSIGEINIWQLLQLNLQHLSQDSFGCCTAGCSHPRFITENGLTITSDFSLSRTQLVASCLLTDVAAENQPKSLRHPTSKHFSPSHLSSLALLAAKIHKQGSATLYDPRD